MSERRCIDPELIIPISRLSTEAFKTGTWGTRRPVHEEKASPCRVACPAGNNIPMALAKASLRDYDGALAAFLEESPLPGVCGRACYHLCEGECNRGQWDGAVHIQALERAASELGTARPQALTDAGKDVPVAVVGSGPAGLSAAYHLARMGHPVTLVESEEALGGLLRWGIPQYRVPLGALERDLARILSLDLRVQTGTRLDGALLEELRSSHKAVFLALGAQRSLGVDIPGNTLPEVWLGVDFLKAVRQEALGGIQGWVVVVGGGNVAIDAALTARRLGARGVDLVCLEQREEMPAHEREISDALEEGLTFHNGWGPKGIRDKNGKVGGVECVRCLSVFDGEGKFNPSYDESSTLDLEADHVILATGQALDLSALGEGGPFGEELGSALQVEERTLQTGISGIYAGGDMVKAPGSVVEAIGAGKRAALAIHLATLGKSLKEAEGRVLMGEGATFSIHALFHERSGWEPSKVVRFEELEPLFLEDRPRRELPRVRPELRTDFREINLSVKSDEAAELAGRCFFCGTCTGCDRCYLYCPENSIVPPDAEKAKYEANDDYCKGCAACAAVCPRGVMSMGEGK